jgi:steroid delta-isomerase-like uncharacterized protein
MDSQDSPVEAFVESINARDLDKVCAVLPDDFLFEEVAGPGAASVDGLLSELRMIFAAFPDIVFRPVRHSRDGNRTLVEFRAIGTHNGEFVGVPPTGSVAVASGVFSAVEAGRKIARLRLTVDFGGLRRQLLTAQRRSAIQ